MTNLIAEIGKVLPKSRVAKSSEMKTKVTTTMFSGCGMNTKELEGIIEKYCDLFPFDELEDFDVYTEGHPNAVIYDAIQEYVDKNNLSDSTSEQRIVDLFCTIYQVAQKAQYRRDLWIYRKTMEQEIYEKTRKLIGSWDYSGNEMNNYEPDDYAESIVTGAVIFLLSNQPNQSPRYRRDLKKLEERYAKDKSFTDYDPAIDCLYERHVPPFLPYLWQAIEEASINNAVLEDEIAPEILQGYQPTIIEEVRKQEVAKEEQAQPSASPAQKTTLRIFTSEEEEETAKLERVKEAITQLMTEKFGDTRCKFQKSNWYAVYFVFEKKVHHNITPKTFSDLMINWGLTEKNINDNISHAVTKKLPSYLHEWKNYRYGASSAEKKQIDVALRFIEILKDKKVL